MENQRIAGNQAAALDARYAERKREKEEKIEKEKREKERVEKEKKEEEERKEKLRKAESAVKKEDNKNISNQLRLRSILKSFGTENQLFSI